MSTDTLTLEQICQVCQESACQQHEHRAQGSSMYPLSQPPATPLPTDLHAVLRHLVTTLTLPLPLSEILELLARLTLQALNIDLCVFLLKDSQSEQLLFHTSSPVLQPLQVQIEPLHLSHLQCETFARAAQRGELLQLREHEIEQLNPLKNVRYKTLQPIPLLIGSECLGLLNCYASYKRVYSADEQLMLSTIANQSALMLKHRLQLEEELLIQHNLLKAFIHDLLSDKQLPEDSLRRHAYELSFGLTEAHLLILLERIEPLQNDATAIHEQHELALREIKQSVQARFPKSLFAEYRQMQVCLIELDAEITQEDVQHWFCTLVTEEHPQFAAGISNPCTELSSYRRGHAEALEALRIAQYLESRGSCQPFAELGAVRYLYQFARTDLLHDQYQEQIATIVAYDQRKKTTLLDTLESYLECGGNAAKTSVALDVHRNTLLQRLERLQKLCALDLEQIPNRLPLLLALKVHRIRARGLPYFVI